MAMVLGEELAREDPAFNYHLLRSALDHCKRNLSALDGEQFREVRSKALFLGSVMLLVMEKNDGEIVSLNQARNKHED